MMPKRAKHLLGVKVRWFGVALAALLALVVGPWWLHTSNGGPGELADAYAARRSDVWVEAAGQVSRLLPDDLDGSRHQRFILRVTSDQTLLIAHNIDLAPRLDGLGVGDTVAFRGEYVWNRRGGIVHWTHRDPDGRQPGGWLEWQGRRYR